MCVEFRRDRDRGRTPNQQEHLQQGHSDAVQSSHNIAASLFDLFPQLFQVAVVVDDNIRHGFLFGKSHLGIDPRLAFVRGQLRISLDQPRELYVLGRGHANGHPEQPRQLSRFKEQGQVAHGDVGVSKKDAPHEFLEQDAEYSGMRDAVEFFSVRPGR